MSLRVFRPGEFRGGEKSPDGSGLPGGLSWQGSFCVYLAWWLHLCRAPWELSTGDRVMPLPRIGLVCWEQCRGSTGPAKLDLVAGGCAPAPMLPCSLVSPPMRPASLPILFQPTTVLGAARERVRWDSLSAAGCWGLVPPLPLCSGAGSRRA